MQEHVMSEEMKLFFGKLLELKEDAKNWSCNADIGESADCVWREVYERLNEIIKEKQ